MIVVFNLEKLRIVRNISLVLTFVVLIPTMALAQEEEEISFPLDNFYVERQNNALRGFLTKLTLGVSLGYGRTFFKHKLNSFNVYQDSVYGPKIFPTSGSPQYQSWINKLELDTAANIPGSYLVSSDSSELGFKGRGLNIPIKLTLHYEFKRYRVGVGYSYEFMRLGEFNPTSFQNDIRSFRPPDPNGFMSKYFVVLGGSFYRWDKVLFVADANIGGFKPGKNFTNSAIKKGIYANIGVSAEYQFSEYLTAFVRPSFEFKNYTMNFPEVDRKIKHNMNALYVNVGLAYKLPKLPKCYHPDCHAQINHAHGNKEYRSRMHGIFKKQNPHYGENYPKLIKEKRKNKKKINPY